MELMIQGCPVYYEISDCTNDNAPVVLFLHGWGCDSTIFTCIANSIGENAKVVTIDFPGHGKSGKPPVPWGVQEYTDMLKKLLEQNHLHCVNIIAHSFGGRIGIVLANKYPDFVHKLLITGGAGIAKPVSAKQRKRIKQFKRYNKLLALLKAIPLLAPKTEKWQTTLRSRFGSSDYVKLDEIMRKTFVKVISEDLSPFLGEIKAPTLLIWGSADTETPLWMGEQMERNIPDAGLVIFPGKSHYAFLEEWQRFVLIAKKFMLEEYAG